MTQTLAFFNKSLVKIEPRLIELLLVLIFFSEAYSKLCLFSSHEKPMLPFFIKGASVLIAVGFLMKKNYRTLIGPVILCLIFAIGQLSLPVSFEWPVLISLSKYLFALILFQAFNLLSSQNRMALLTTFERIIVFNSILVIIGTLFNIYVFKNYQGPRFGYNGLFIVSSTATYFLLFSLCYFLICYREKINQKWQFWILVLACGLQGSKSIYLALALFLLFYLIYFVKSKTIKYSLISIISFAVVCFAYYLFFINPVFTQLRLSEGLLTSILSLRDQLFMNRTLPFINNNWTLSNYLFGGLSQLSTRTQMSLIDQPYFWGLLGSIIFFFYYLKAYVTFQWKTRILMFSFSLILLISVLSGNLFYNASCVIYLLILREGILYSQNKITAH